MNEQRLALVVDDHYTNRLLAATLLKRLRWSVLEASDGLSALALSRENDLRLILLDISMPGLSGEETCRQLRAAHDGSPLKIIAYTAHAFAEDRQRLLAGGFDEVLVKPITRQQLENLVGDL
ncbi:response regulator [Dechloromonas sp. XY25]|uniref:Response regulator n=1 Tax=Dechloromonas hankyongensis TaxID=2908002 RepID=A0ABS9K6V6_9RHOO|nr:response regulator [Dechloromonas hankyongensis]MCG2578898.1 response regulator [Dechloromonas hankyongensis]